MTSESDPIDAQLLKRYRQASDADPVAPSDAARAAILAEARRVAEQPTAPAFDTSQPAANQSRFRLAAFGTLGAVLLTALIAVPQLWERPPTRTATERPSLAANAPAAAPTAEALASAPPAPSLAPSASASRQAALQEQLAEVVVAQKSAERAQAAKENRMSAALQRRKSEPDNYTPSPPLAAGHADRLSSFADRTAAPSAAASSAQSAPAASLDAHVAAADTAGIAKIDRAALDTRDTLGRTPLMLATLAGQVETVRSLLGRGANPNIADNDGKTPLQVAKAGNFEEITQLLEVAGAH